MSKKFSSCCALLVSLCGCSDLWSTYQVVDNADLSTNEPDLPTTETNPCDKPDLVYYKEDTTKDTTYTVCCGPDNEATTASNTAATIKQAQFETAQTTPITITFNCEWKTIYFSPSDTMGTALPEITRDVTVEGKKNTFNGSGTSRLFRVGRSGKLTLQDLFIENGKAVQNGGFACPNSGATATDKCALGGAILSIGELTLERVSIKGSKAYHTSEALGGAIFSAGSYLAIKNSILYGNRADTAGCGSAIYSVNTNTVQIDYSTITGNKNGTTGLAGATTFRRIPNINGDYPDSKVYINNSILVNHVFDNITKFVNLSVYIKSIDSSCKDRANLLIDGQTDYNNGKTKTMVDKAKIDSSIGCSSLSIDPYPSLLSSISQTLSSPIFPSTTSPVGSASKFNGTDSLDGLVKSTDALKADCRGLRDFHGNARPQSPSLCYPGALNVEP